LKITRKLYNWVISWAERPGSTTALFLLAFAESSFFPIPPDVLLIAMGFAQPKKAWRFAVICGAGSVLGGIAGYLIGMTLMEVAGYPIINFYHLQSQFDHVRTLFEQYDAIVVAVAGFTPIPYKVFTIAAGAFDINFLVFVGASLVSRFARFFIEAGLIRWKGEEARVFVERYLEWVVLGVTALGVAGFLLIKKM